MSGAPAPGTKSTALMRSAGWRASDASEQRRRGSHRQARKPLRARRVGRGIGWGRQRAGVLTTDAPMGRMEEHMNDTRPLGGMEE